MAVTACACAGQRSLAITTLKDMKDSGIYPDITVYHAILSACARSVLHNNTLPFVCSSNE
jgi:pentatricopeptide repeat protein